MDQDRYPTRSLIMARYDNRGIKDGVICRHDSPRNRTNGDGWTLVLTICTDVTISLFVVLVLPLPSLSLSYNEKQRRPRSSPRVASAQVNLREKIGT